MYKNWPDFDPKELGFVEQRKLFDRLCDQMGKAPPVIDSDGLLENPHGTVEAYSNAAGIPLMPEALSWEPGTREEVSWWDGGSFHDYLRKSDGLNPRERHYVDIENLPDRVQRIYEMVLPHYEALYINRL